MIFSGAFVKYYSIFLLSVRQARKNIQGLVCLGFFLVTCLVIFQHLWEVVVKDEQTFISAPALLLWFITLNEWILVSIPDVHKTIEEDLRSGRIAFLLTRPISYLLGTFIEALGKFVVNFLFLGGIALGYAWYFTGALPLAPLFSILAVVLGFFAGVVAITWQMSIGISAFWLLDVTPLYWVWEKSLFTLGGLLLPLASYPLWLQKAAHCTPFPFILGGRSALVLEPTSSYALYLGCMLVVWMSVALVVLRVLFQKTLKIMQVAGG